MPRSSSTRSRRSQRGIILLMLLIILALIIIGMAVAAPRIALSIKREREIEMIHRGAEYSRAVKKYYKKFGRYPASIEQLENTNNIRFLRKRFSDPMSKDGKWRPVRYGEVQLGQQGAGSGSIGGLGGGGALPPVVGGTLSQSGNLQPSTPQLGVPQSPSSNFGPSSSFGQQGQPTTGQQPGSGFGQPGQSFGGGAIMGVASTSEAKGFHEYNEKSQYKQWLFVYVPTVDRGALITGPYDPKAFVGQAPQVGTPAGQMNQQQQPSSIFSTSPALGAPPTSAQPTQSPQQNP